MGPQAWLKDAAAQGAPVLGSLVELRVLCKNGKRAIGRYVHCWNNIGRVVPDVGATEMVSF